MKEKRIAINTNKEKCQKIKNDYRKEFKKLCPGFVPNCKEGIKSVKRKYKEKIATIPNCRIIGL